MRVVFRTQSNIYDGPSRELFSQVLNTPLLEVHKFAYLGSEVCQ